MTSERRNNITAIESTYYKIATIQTSEFIHRG